MIKAMLNIMKKNATKKKAIERDKSNVEYDKN